MHARPGLFAATLGLTLLGSGMARPEPETRSERVRIDYLAPADCPDQAAFERGVSDRLNRLWAAMSGELARTIRVVVTKEGRGLVARMAFTDAQGRPVSRAVSAERCEDAVSGIALVTALALQAFVFGDEPPPAQPVPRAAASASPAPPPPVEPASVSPVRRGFVSRPVSLAQEAGLQFGVSSGIGPGVPIGVGVLWGVGSVSHPSLVRLVADWYDTGTVHRGGSAVRFQLAAGRLESCPVRLGLTRALVLPACVGFEAGVLTAAGRERAGVVVNPRTVHLPWAAALLAPRLRLETERLFAELVAEERFPLVGQTFRFNRQHGRVYEIHHVALGGVAAVGLRFP